MRERDAITAKRAELADDPAGVLRCTPARSVRRAAPPASAVARSSTRPPAARGRPPGRAVIREHRAWLTTQIVELLDKLGVTEPAAKANQAYDAARRRHGGGVPRPGTRSGRRRARGGCPLDDRSIQAES
ncbi:hypothetical protein [Aeromicrobium sp. UC242_57]|uniref:hypothetical protein n=1 Tax=Aeromicrobium sp. UC242_57 TaxID=3374624 RepID=UPI00379F4101